MFVLSGSNVGAILTYEGSNSCGVYHFSSLERTHDKNVVILIVVYGSVVLFLELSRGIGSCI